MGNPEKYWILYGVNSFGNSQSRELSEVKTFLVARFQLAEPGEAIEDKIIQRRLFDWYGIEKTQEQVNAELCLRCFVSNSIYQFCLATEQQYKDSYGLTKNDLFPVLLDSITKVKLTNTQAKNSLIKEIIDSFSLEKNSNLSTWTKIKVKGNKRYKRVLKFYGIVEVTDWLILVHTTPGKLERRLKERGYSEFERKEYGNLLEIFHQVYSTELFKIREEINRQRLEEGKRRTNKPYPSPTEEQLNHIARLLDNSCLLESQEILAKLKKIAQFMRNYNSATPGIFRETKTVQPNSELIVFVQEQIEDNLFAVVNRVINTKVNYFLGKRKPQTEKANNFILILKLFHCEQYSMGEIASLINFTDQSQVSRLVKLKELRQDISRNAIALLKDIFTDRLTGIVRNPEQLSALDTKVQEFLEAEIKEIMDEAKKEALNSQNRTRNSLFSRTVCESVQQRININNNG